ncbi:MAG: 30S ribosomal protein S20 [Patescibacteria group bacterium]|nr:30S ribosomal protein S20 [Patescibacteria group bacterium]
MITKSAKKAYRQNIRRRAKNSAQKEAMKKVLKSYKKLVAAKKADEARALLPKVYTILDKTAKTGAIKKNTASRMKSRLAKSLVKLK